MAVVRLDNVHRAPEWVALRQAVRLMRKNRRSVFTAAIVHSQSVAPAPAPGCRGHAPRRAKSVPH